VTRARPHPETGSSQGQEEYGQWRAGGATASAPTARKPLPAAALNPPRACHLVDTGLGSTDKQGSRNLRWALIEAIQHVPAGHPLRQRKDDIMTRRGAQARNIAKVAMARQLLTWVFYAMRDGQVRSLAAAGRQAA
jgi:hypothetical protein